MVNHQEILKAAQILKGQAYHTPLLKSHVIDEMTGANVYFKAEVLQVMGSFKFRGAFNAISKIPEHDRIKGVVAASSGNHAQGIAEAARRLGVNAKIVMPSDAPEIKIARTRRSGAEVILYDRMNEDRVAICHEIVENTGETFIHPYDNAHVIAGQGTVGLEIVSDLHRINQNLDRVFICTGGGGLTAGMTIAIKEAFGNAAIHPCEPKNFDDYARSLKAGKRLGNHSQGGSICDAIVTPSPGELSFEICKSVLSDGKICSDEEAMRAVAIAFTELKLSVEPGGAIALAALLQSGKTYAGETIAVTLSGGNIDPKMLEKCLAL